MAEQSKKMAAERLSFVQRKVILKWYWKVENVCEVQRRRPISRIRDKFEAHGIVLKSLQSESRLFCYCVGTV
jgi:hypothetical protein